MKVIKQLSISPVESILVWPTTSEYKGTRITERISFVISSQKWQKLYEEKKKGDLLKSKRMLKKKKKERNLKINKQKYQRGLKTTLKNQILWDIFLNL